MEIKSKTVNNMVRVIQEFILQDFMPFPKNTVGMISAKGGVGKTNLSLILAGEYVKSEVGNVALWLTEDEEGNIKHRINTLIDAKIMDNFNELRVHYILNEPVHFSKIKGKEFEQDSDSLNSLKTFCLVNDIRFLIIDPLLAFFGGSENDNGQARIFMQPFIEWCKYSDINIIFIHHSSKGEVANTRGAGAFQDATRCAYTMSIPLLKDEKNHIVEDFVKSNQGLRTIHCMKDNRGAIIDILKIYGENPFNIQITPPINFIYKSKDINCEEVTYEC